MAGPYLGSDLYYWPGKPFSTDAVIILWAIKYLAHTPLVGVPSLDLPYKQVGVNYCVEKCVKDLIFN